MAQTDDQKTSELAQASSAASEAPEALAEEAIAARALPEIHELTFERARALEADLAQTNERLVKAELAAIGYGQSLVTALNEINRSALEQHSENVELEARMLEIMVRSRYAMPHAGNAAAGQPPVSGPVLSLDAYDDKLRELAPLNWEAFVACRDTGTDSYDDLPEVSCSTERHPQAHLFRAFVRPYLKGTVLDVGCGPQPVPFYLAGYPTQAISGIDPISSVDDHPFQFVSGYGEFLPWEDEAFDIVISGTVLDHYYLLDKGLAEVFRVLKPGGRFLAWITHFADAPPYDPYAGVVKPYDHEHMYHINLEWFRPLMREIGFVENEIIEFPLPFRFLFMAFEKPTAEHSTFSTNHPA